MTFEESLKLLNTRQNFIKKNGFYRIEKCLSVLGNPHSEFKAVHVTGTNGKGSVCAMFAEAFRTAGYKTGLYISPHLTDIRERIQINGVPVSREEFAGLMKDVFDASSELSYFEVLTCMAYLHFARRGTDIAVVEVGIGGRSDSTNVLPSSLLSVITSVDFDHKQMLGPTLREIAYQKAGIIKQDGLVITPVLPEEAALQIISEAAAKKAKLEMTAPVFETVSCDWNRGGMYIRHKTTGKTYYLNVLGKHQLSNATLVWKGLEMLSGRGIRVSEEQAASAFGTFSWNGRFQVVRSGPGLNNTVFIVDGAHNPQAARSFGETWLQSPFSREDAVFVIGAMKDKEYIYMLKVLSGFRGRFIFTKPDLARGESPEKLAGLFRGMKPEADIVVFDRLADAFAYSSRCGKNVAVVGSLYLAGAVLNFIAEH